MKYHFPLTSAPTFLFLLLFLFACSYKEGLFPQQDSKGRFELHLPDFVSPTSRFTDKTDFQFQNRFRSFYVIVLASEKDGDESSLSDYAEREIVILNSGVDSVASDTTFVWPIQDLDAVHYKADLHIDGELLTYRLAFTEDKKHFYSIVIWTLESRKEQFEELMEEITYSFNLR